MPIYFNRALCYLWFASFLYNRTTFENYISCNDLILLIAIQKKSSLPPNNHPGEIKVLTRGQLNMASTLVETKIQKMRRNKSTTKRCVASVFQEWGPWLLPGSGKAEPAACSTAGSRVASLLHRPHPGSPQPSLGVVKIL